jgi:hypothetical protein
MYVIFDSLRCEQGEMDTRNRLHSIVELCHLNMEAVLHVN